MATQARDKLEAWLDNPNTPKDAWKTLTYREIADQAEVSESSVYTHFEQLLAERMEVDAVEIRRIRQEMAFEKGSHGKRIPIHMQEKMKYAKFVEKKDLKEISLDFNISYSGVQKFFKRLEKETEQQQ